MPFRVAPVLAVAVTVAVMVGLAVTGSAGAFSHVGRVLMGWTDGGESVSG